MTRRLANRIAFSLSLLLLLAVQASTQAAQELPPAVRAPRLGITFISSLDHPANDLRYQRALLLGAAWNRWPLYWDRVERAAGVYDWSGYDRLVAQDIQHGLSINAILLGRPAFQALGGGIQGLNLPAFADGSDIPAPGKLPNPANPWAVFVYNAVSRYKPGGLLASSLGWPAGAGITVWEAWNEPDLSMFWSAGVEQYARLLKLTYLVAHQADPAALVMFGGLAYGNPDQDDWLAKVLAIYAADPLRQTFNWYMDQVAVHNYTYARRSGLVVNRIESELAKYGLNRPVWLNESGVPAWDDYPGPVWTAAVPAERQYRATMQQQANFWVTSTVLAWASGADVVFYHQLYDDCGNQGGDFPPHNGEYCATGAICAGDAFGLYRNERGEACFSHHPLPGSPRPVAGAFYRMAQIFGATAFANPHVDSQEGTTVVTFDRPTTGERILVMWNRTTTDLKLDVPALGDSAQLYDIANQDYELIPTGGKYTIGLQPLTADNLPGLPAGELSGIAGAPMILVEKINPALLVTLAAPITPTPEGTPAPRATVDPTTDITPPTTTMTALPPTSPTTFAVEWAGSDDSGVDRYLVWVRMNGGKWQPWLETGQTRGFYTGSAGNTYDFAVWAVDLAGNWSLNSELVPQASTVVE